MADGNAVTNELIAHAFAASAWLLYYEVARDLFPGVQVHALSPTQDQAVTNRVYGLIAVAKNKLLPPATPGPTV